MLPHIRNRPLSLLRFPDGIDGHGFFHKNVPDYFPDFVKRVEVEKRGGTVVHAVVCDTETLVYLVGQNTITPHVWLSRADRLRQPDRIVFDLDPAPGADFAAVRRAARRTGDLLREIGLEPFAQVTGSKGIHVWTPLRRRATFEDVRAVRARRWPRCSPRRHPDELTIGVPQVRARRAHPRGHHAQRLRPDGGAALCGPAARRARPWPRRSSGTSCPTRSCAPIAGRSTSVLQAAALERRPLGRHRLVRARAVAGTTRAWTRLARE